MKTCRSCGTTRRLEEFPLQKGGRDGWHPLCKPCRSAQERRRYRRDRIAILARMRADLARPRRLRRRALERKYGLSLAEHQAMVVLQRALCAVCGVRTPLVVDHDHLTGAVRGLLCPSCNLALGELRDDPARCDAAATYLEQRS